MRTSERLVREVSLADRPWGEVTCRCGATVRTRVRGRAVLCRVCRQYTYVPATFPHVPGQHVPASAAGTIRTAGGQDRPVTDDALAAHVTWMRSRGLADSTMRQRAQNLMALQARHAPRALLELDHDALFAWQLEQASRVSVSTLLTLLVDARQFYRWAVRQGLLEVDPTARLDMPRVPRRAPRPIPDARLRRAIDAAPAPVRAMLVLAAFAGLRAKEVAGLRWEDVDEDAGTLFIRGKGGHERVVPASSVVIAALDELRRHYEGQGVEVGRRGPVLRNGYGRPGTVPAHHVSHHANRFLRSIDVPDTFHSLRHRFGTKAYGATKDLRLTQRLLGHATVATTELYVDVDESRGRAAVEAIAGL